MKLFAAAAALAALPFSPLHSASAVETGIKWCQLSNPERNCCTTLEANYLYAPEAQCIDGAGGGGNSRVTTPRKKQPKPPPPDCQDCEEEQ